PGGARRDRARRRRPGAARAGCAGGFHAEGLRSDGRDGAYTLRDRGATRCVRDTGGGGMMMTNDGRIVTAPRSVEETGIRRNLLEDLALKTLYVLGELGLRELADHMRVSFRIVEELFARLRKD